MPILKFCGMLIFVLDVLNYIWASFCDISKIGKHDFIFAIFYSGIQFCGADFN